MSRSDPDDLELLLHRAATAHAAVPAVARLGADDAEWLLRTSSAVRFRAGEPLARAGDWPGRVLLLRAGHVRISRPAPSGKELMLGFRGPHELVGAQAAVDRAPRATSVTAIAAVDARAVTLEHFETFLDERPQAARALLRVMSGRLHEAEALAVAFSSPAGAIGRLAIRLLELCERFGEADGLTTRIELPLTWPELAEWSAASLESFELALRVMGDHGWVEADERRIRVLDGDALRRLTFAT